MHLAKSLIAYFSSGSDVVFGQIVGCSHSVDALALSVIKPCDFKLPKQR